MDLAQRTWRLTLRRAVVVFYATLIALVAMLGMVTSVQAAPDTCEGYDEKRNLTPDDEDRTGTEDVFNSDGEKIGTITWDNVSDPEKVSWSVEEGYTLDVCVKGGDETATGSGQSGTVFTPRQDNGNTPAVSHYAWSVNEPDEEPSDEPTDEPTGEPSDEPTEEPSDGPSDQPTDEPSDEPTDEPTDEPSDEPTEQPSGEPSDEPTDEPSDEPTDEPTVTPTDEPTDGPSDDPSDGPSNGPGVNPRDEPTDGPGVLPTDDSRDGPSNGSGGGRDNRTDDEPTEVASGEEPGGDATPESGVKGVEASLPATGAFATGGALGLAMTFIATGGALLRRNSPADKPQAWLRAV